MKKPLGKVAFGLGIKLAVYFFLSAFLFDANTLVSAGAGTAAALAAVCLASTIGVTSRQPTCSIQNSNSLRAGVNAMANRLLPDGPKWQN